MPIDVSAHDHCPGCARPHERLPGSYLFVAHPECVARGEASAPGVGVAEAVRRVLQRYMISVERRRE